MPALYAIIQPAMQVDGPTFGVIADENGADYVFRDGEELGGLNAERVKRVAGARDTPPQDESQWLAAAIYNIGYFVVGERQQAPTLDDARTAVTALIAQSGTRELTPAETAPAAVAPDAPDVPDDSTTPEWQVPKTRAELARYQADAAYVWSMRYPEAASGEVNDPEAELALRHLMTPPVDPTKPHAWLPIATTETECGFCEQPQDAAIHTR